MLTGQPCQVQTSGYRGRSSWILYAPGLIFLASGAVNLATFSSGGPISKWLQLGLAILCLVLAVAWLTWLVPAAKRRSKK